LSDTELAVLSCRSGRWDGGQTLGAIIASLVHPRINCPQTAQFGIISALPFAEGVNWPEHPWRGIAIMLASIVIKLFAAMQMLAAGLAFGVMLRPAEYLFVMIFLAS
jgi:hypothetical protein